MNGWTDGKNDIQRWVPHPKLKKKKNASHEQFQHFETSNILRHMILKQKENWKKVEKTPFWITPFWNPCNIMKYLKN